MDAPQCTPRRPATQPAWAPVYACSSCAYRSINFFVPRAGKLTETRRSSSSPSTPTIVPTPKLGWRTLRPSMGFASPPRFADGAQTNLNPQPYGEAPLVFVRGEHGEETPRGNTSIPDR